MSAGKHGAHEYEISMDSAPGGALVRIEDFIITIDGFEIENVLQLTAALGDEWDEHTATGRRRSPAIKMTGFFDDSSDGPHEVMQVTDDDADPNAASRTFVAVVSNTNKTFTTEVRLQKYKVLAKNGNLTEFETMIQPTGLAVWS